MIKRYCLIMLILTFEVAVCQDSRKIFIGRYVGIQKQTNTPGGTYYDYNAVARIEFGDSLQQNVFFYDSCSWAPNWTGAPGSFKAHPDSTIRAWGNSSIIHGRLYANDSLYFVYLTGGPGNTMEEFFGFKIKTGVGMNELAQSEINLVKVYPNPVQDFLYITNKNEADIKYVLSTTNGKQIPLEQNTNEKIDVSALPDGLYFLQIQTKERILAKKIIVQH